MAHKWLWRRAALLASCAASFSSALAAPIPKGMRERLMLPLGVSFGAAIFAQAEGTFMARWGADRSTACSGPSPAAGCALNGTISVVAGTFFAVETLAAVLVALVLVRNGKRLGAAVAVAALACALALEHVWLLT